MTATAPRSHDDATEKRLDRGPTGPEPIHGLAPDAATDGTAAREIASASLLASPAIVEIIMAEHSANPLDHVVDHPTLEIPVVHAAALRVDDRPPESILAASRSPASW